MFQIIYRRIYLLYVVMDSFYMACTKEAQHLTCSFPQLILFTVFSTFGLFLSVACLAFKSSSRCAFHYSTVLHNVEVVEDCVSAAGKTSMMQLCCHFRVTNRQWQTIRKGERVQWCRWQTAMTFGSFGLQSGTYSVYLRSAAVWTCHTPSLSPGEEPGLSHSSHLNRQNQ